MCAVSQLHPGALWMYTCGTAGQLIDEMGLPIRSWKSIWGITIVLCMVAPNIAGEAGIYNITLLRPWVDAITGQQCEQVGYLNIICQQVQDELGDSLSTDFNFLGVVPTLSGSTSLLFNTTTNNASHAADVLSALQTLVSAGRVHALTVSPSVLVIPHPQTDLAAWMLNPGRGPMSGGTRVTIIGFFTQDMDVYIGDQQCETQNRSLVLHICRTVALNDDSLTNNELDISFQDGGGTMYPSNFTYNYTTNPTVTKVQPLKVILSGGIDLTVSGWNLDTVQNSIMRTVVTEIAENRTGSKIYTTDCRGSSSTEMICPTAVIGLGDISRRRRKRQVKSVNMREMIDVQVSFLLDDVPPIQLTEYRTLEVFDDPVLVAFEPPKFTQTLRGTTITIQGRGLLAALTQTDYTVTVGGESCTNVKVLSSQIECEPPRTQPKTEDLGPGRTPVVVHYVGRVREVGFLLYPDDTLRKILIGVGVVLSCLVITLVSVGVYCYFQHSNTVSTPDPEHTPYTKPAIFEKPGTFRKPPMADGTARGVKALWSESTNPRRLSQYLNRSKGGASDGHNQDGRNDQYYRHNQYGHHKQNGRYKQNEWQDDQRPSRQVWPGSRQNRHSPGSSAAYVHRATVNSIVQHDQRAMIPTPPRHLHAAVWNWDDHA